MLSFFSNAKINLGLQILNKREDGYHNLHSLFIEIDLADELLFRKSSVFKLGIEGADLPLDENNLITKAYRLIRSKVENVQTEYAIFLKKKIPIGGGLGGGSSNAATVLTTLNQLWELNLLDNELENMSNSLGGDVPFFIRGGIQLVEGIGDIVIPIDPSPMKNLQFILVVPPIHISTHWAYREINKTLRLDKSRPKFAPLSKPMNWELFENDFEQVIHTTYPKIGLIKTTLQNAGALYAGLSGSGSTVFGVFNNLKKAEPILGDFPQYQTYLSSPVIR